MSEYSNYIEARDAFVSAAKPTKGSKLLFQEDLRKKRIAFSRARDVWEEYLRRHPVLRLVSQHEEALAIDRDLDSKRELQEFLDEEKKRHLREERRERNAAARARFLKSRESAGYDVTDITTVFHLSLSSLPENEYLAQAVERPDLYYYLDSLTAPTGAFKRRRSWHSAEHRRKDWHDPLCG